jgi:hypothetical protein
MSTGPAGPMSLLDSSVLQIEQQSSQLEYEISDEAGRLIGRAGQVAGPKPRKGLLAMFGSGVKDARVVIQVGDLNGTPVFFVDRKGDLVAIVAPDGNLIGRFVYDLVGVAQRTAPDGIASGAAHMAGVVLGSTAPALTHRLLDAGDRPLCQLDWTLKPVGTYEDRRWVPVGCTCSDMHGQQVAQLDVREATFKDRYILRLLDQVPEPMRTLVVASPLAFDLTRS